MDEYPAGEAQVVVTYRTDAWEQVEGAGYSDSLVGFIAKDAASRATDGWQIATWDTVMTGFTGSAGNLLFNTGGGSPTNVAVTVVYQRVA